MTETPGRTVARDPRPALIVAGVVLAYAVLRALVGLIGWAPGGGVDTGAMSYFGRQIVVEQLPFAIGVFVMLLVLPVRSGDSVIAVLGKGLLAAAAGTVLSSVVGVMVQLAQANLRGLLDVQYLGPLMLPVQIVTTTVATAPLVMLAALVVHLMRRPAAAG